MPTILMTEIVGYQVCKYLKQHADLCHSPFAFRTATDMSASDEKFALQLGDASQIHQVVINHCTNAGYAMVESDSVLMACLNEVDLDQNFADANRSIRPGRLRNGDDAECAQPDNRSLFTTKDKGDRSGMGAFRLM